MELIDMRLFPKCLKTLNLNLGSVGDRKWLRHWLSSSLSAGVTLEHLLPNLTSFGFTYAKEDWKSPEIPHQELLPLLSLPLTRLAIPSAIHIHPSQLPSLNCSTLMDLEMSLIPNASSSSFSSSSATLSASSSSSSPVIEFPCNLTRLHISNLPAKFPFILLPRTLLDLHIIFAPYGGDDAYNDDYDNNDNDGSEDDDSDDYSEDNFVPRKVQPQRLRDWPPHLTKLSVRFDDDALIGDIKLTSAIASSLPRTLLSLDWGIEFFDDHNVLREMPPNLTKCSTRVRFGYGYAQKEINSEIISLLPNTLTSIPSTYLSNPEVWKFLPRTITEVREPDWLGRDASSFIQDLPPLLAHLSCRSSFFINSPCPVLHNITRLSILLDHVKPEEGGGAGGIEAGGIDPAHSFFNIISTQLPHLQRLDLGWKGFWDMPLLDILQQPIKTLLLACDPRTLNFTSGTWSKSLQSLVIRKPDGFKCNEQDMDAFIEQRDPIGAFLQPSHHFLVILLLSLSLLHLLSTGLPISLISTSPI
jgi:hypothetical protein